LPFRRFLKNHKAVLGAAMVLVYVAVALLAPWLAPHNATKPDLDLALKPPRPGYLLGNDELGRDILSRIIWGARISLLIGLMGTAIAVAGGILFGAVAGYFGGLIDSIIMRVMDILLAFPSFLLALAIVAILGPGLINLMLAVGIFSIPSFSRVVRGSVLSVKNLDFIEAGRAQGFTDVRILFRHVLPNCLAPIIVLATMRIATAILTASGLSFLGLGAQPPTPEWGAMLSNGRDYLRSAPHLSTFPGLAIMFGVLGFNLFGDGLRDALDPRLKT